LPHQVGFRTWLIHGLTAALLVACIGAARADPRPARRSPIIAALRLVAPSVVNVYVVHALTGEPQPLEDPLFHQYFSQFIDPRQGQGGEPSQMSLGSGVIVSAGGLIVTNRHLLHLSGDLMIETEAGLVAPARLIAVAEDADLALLQAQTDAALPAAPLGKAADPMLGETVFAVGNPFGAAPTVTAGIISDLHRALTQVGYTDMIVTTAPINPGNSGGPLIDESGQVIAINTAIYAQGTGLNFAIPSKQVSSFLTAHRAVSHRERRHSDLSGAAGAR